MSTETTTQDTTLTIFNGDIQFKNGDKVILASEIPTIEKVNEAVKKVKEDFTKDQIVTELYEYEDLEFTTELLYSDPDDPDYNSYKYYLTGFELNNELCMAIQNYGLLVKIIDIRTKQEETQRMYSYGIDNTYEIKSLCLSNNEMDRDLSLQIFINQDSTIDMMRLGGMYYNFIFIKRSY